MPWTQEREDMARQLWAQGFTARAIATKVGGGITRNGVIGKAHRKNWPRVNAPLPPPPPPAVVVKAAPEPKPPPRARFESWMCRWPTTDPGKFGLFICAKTCQPGRHYCAEHLTLAYVQRKKPAA